MNQTLITNEHLKRKNNYLVLASLLFALSVIITFYGTITDRDSASFSVIIFTLIFLILVLRNSKSLPLSICIFLSINYLIKVIYAYIMNLSIISPFPDSFAYIKELDNIMRLESIDFISVSHIVGSLHIGYHYLMLITYKLFGTRISLYLINILLFSISAILFYKVVLLDFGKRIAYITSCAVLFSTNMFMFTSHILKDSLVLFLTMLIIYLYKTKPIKRAAILILPCLVLLVMTRIYTGFSIFTALMIDILILNWRNFHLLTRVAAISLLTITVSFFIQSAFYSKYIDISLSFASKFDIFNVLSSFPIAIFKIIFSPLPWNMFNNSSEYNILVVDSTFFMIASIGVVLFIIKYISDRNLRTKMSFYLIPLFIHALVLGLEYDGNSTRQRIAVFFFIILMFFVGFFYKKVEKKRS